MITALSKASESTLTLNDTDETVEQLMLWCPAHDQAQRDIWLEGKVNTDPGCFWNFLEQIGGDLPLSRPGMRQQEGEVM